ncbi:hypothetical protein FOA52_005597 [Chlamydomonas sp. UWO 241]|nr:hypothetical protein FOA52_005597 [Chlamydomonas sp. UWO 241]
MVPQRALNRVAVLVQLAGAGKPLPGDLEACRGSADQFGAQAASRARAFQVVFYSARRPAILLLLRHMLESWSHCDRVVDVCLTPEVAAVCAVLPAEWRADAARCLPPVLTPQPTLPVTLPVAEEAAAARAAAARVEWRSGPMAGQEPGPVVPLVGPGGLTVRDATAASRSRSPRGPRCQ